MITKKLCKSSEELVQYLLENESLSYEDIQDLLGIEFALEDGSFRTEATLEQQNDPDWEDQGYSDEGKFKISDPELMPTSYPVVVVSIIDDTFDRMGDVSFRFIEYVYLSDFEVTNVVW